MKEANAQISNDLLSQWDLAGFWFIKRKTTKKLQSAAGTIQWLIDQLKTIKVYVIVKFISTTIKHLEVIAVKMWLA